MVACPNCKAILNREDRTMRCVNGHAFDFAKEGYVNLLLPNKKKSLNPGDNKIMINAREAFLATGYFDFLLETINAQIKTVSDSETLQMLDLGCGSGYYTRNLFQSFSVDRIGVDISKVGIAKASKKDKESFYAVASIFDLPIVDSKTDIVLNVFAPIALNEVARVMAKDGLLIKVIPSSDHMKEVAALIYDEVIPHQSSIESEIQSHSDFELLTVEHIQDKVTLSPDNLKCLIEMTPYSYKFDAPRIDALRAMEVTLAFEVIVAKKC